MVGRGARKVFARLKRPPDQRKQQGLGRELALGRLRHAPTRQGGLIGTEGLTGFAWLVRGQAGERGVHLSSRSVEPMSTTRRR